jgi:D-glycerate 3-kinase
MPMTSTPDAPLQSRILDDKSPHCIPFILTLVEQHLASNSSRPFVIGLNGVQGVGKTTLVKALAEALQDREQKQTLVLSIDDFYLTHADQLSLAAAHPDNALVQYRGEPGTHDIELAQATFASMLEGKPTHVPAYDKSAFSGLGDRVPESQWALVNGPDQPRVQVVLLEGWCVGFRPIAEAELERKWRAPSRTLHSHKLEQLMFVNKQLARYDAITDLLDAFIHISAQELEWVYEWRLQQEAGLRRETGQGMTDEQVVKFVDAYYPAYELYSDGVAAGVFRGRKPGHQLCLVVGQDRSVQYHYVI